MPLSAAAIASAVGHVRPSKADTCETQVQVAAQSSRIATLQTGKETVYKPDAKCSGAAIAAGGPPKPSPKKVSAAPTLVVPFVVTVPPPALRPLPAWHERAVTALLQD